MSKGSLIVRKFGGTSMGTAASIIGNVIPILSSLHGKNPQLCVVSAMTGTTNALLSIIDSALTEGTVDKRAISIIREKHLEVVQQFQNREEISLATLEIDQQLEQLEKLLSALLVIGEKSIRAVDACIAIGEKLSANLLSSALRDKGIDSTAIHLDRVGLDGDKYDNDSYWDVLAKRVGEYWNPNLNSIPVFTGFIGFTPHGILQDIGRGYSDYCACLVGQAYRSERVEIWTDVDGVLTTNPKLCPSARLIPSISYDEMAELASFGAKVLHPYSLRPACISGIPIVIKNTFNPECEGTIVLPERSVGKYQFKSIAYKTGVKIIRVATPRMLLVHGFIEKLGKVLSRFEQSVDLISTSEVSVSMSLEGEIKSGLAEALQDLGEVTVSSGRTVISLVGEELSKDGSVLSRVFTCLDHEKVPVEMVSLGDLRLNLGIVVEDQYYEQAIRALHGSFFQ